MILDKVDELGAPGSLRFVRSCSSALSGALLERAEQVYGVPMLEAYGMTEASHQMASNPLPPAPHKVGSVGTATGTELAIVDGELHFQPEGVAGEVVIRGPGVTSGYVNNPAANEEAFFDGWFRTGDRGVLRGGYLFLEGRLKEMILRGGENIAPAEIEEVLLRHPDVLDAVCFGVVDEKYGETVAAAVTLSGEVDERALVEHCRRSLAAFKVPTIHVLKEIPRTATGKVQRRRVSWSSSRRASSAVRVVVLGAGAIGAFVGASLERGGEEVTLVARGPHLKAMQADGVRVIGPGEEFVAHPHATDDLDAIADAEAVFVALKANSLSGSPQTSVPGWRQGRRRSGPRTASPGGIHTEGGPLEGTVLQSVDPGGAIKEAIDPASVVGCVVYCVTEIIQPGVVRHVEGTRFILGEPDGSMSDDPTRPTPSPAAG